MPIYFSSCIVPDTEKYQNAAFNRSGNNALEGISDALWKKDECVIESCIPVPSFPRGRFWIPGCEEVYSSGMRVKMLPTLNVKILKNFFWGILSFYHIIKWRIRNRKKVCSVLIYNLYAAPIEVLYLACKLSNTRLYAILYDLGVPPKHLGLSKTTMLAYRLSELSAKFFIKRLDGRIVINECGQRF